MIQLFNLLVEEHSFNLKKPKTQHPHPKSYVHTHVHSSTKYRSQDPNTTQISNVCKKGSHVHFGEWVEQ